MMNLDDIMKLDNSDLVGLTPKEALIVFNKKTDRLNLLDNVIERSRFYNDPKKLFHLGYNDMDSYCIVLPVEIINGKVVRVGKIRQDYEYKDRKLEFLTRNNPIVHPDNWTTTMRENT